MTKVYLALYKGKGDWVDKLIRLATKGRYSHCEMAVEQRRYKSGDRCLPEVSYICYSSSPRDGGVRCKVIDVDDASKWDLIELSNVTEAQIKAYFEQTNGKKYDLWGALGVVLRNTHSNNRYFCSEWCGRLLGIHESWRFSPNDLAAILKR